MKIHLLNGPGHNQIVNHDNINKPYIIKIQEKKDSTNFKELTKMIIYIYTFSHKMSDGTMYFKCINPNDTFK